MHGRAGRRGERGENVDGSSDSLTHDVMHLRAGVPTEGVDSTVLRPRLRNEGAQDPCP